MARCLLIVVLGMSLAACGDSRLPEYELSGNAMGTTFNITLIDPAEDVADEALQSRIAESLERIDKLASTWKSDSQLSLLNAERTTEWVAVSNELCVALESALEIGRLSEGAFDITVGPLVNLWGFGPDGMVTSPPSDEALASAMESVGYELLDTRCEQPAVRKAHADLYVDLSGWAKGLAVDEVATLLDREGLTDYLVEIGGELRVRGHNAAGEKWAIAVEAPSTLQRKPHSVLRVTDTSVATSGDYRNYFEHEGAHYSHTIDARTGRPVAHDLTAVTVVSESAAFADAMATALLVLGPDAGPRLATNQQIAGYFLVRNAMGIEELTTPEFDLLRN